jgi:hypothetical protein
MGYPLGNRVNSQSSEIEGESQIINHQYLTAQDQIPRVLKMDGIVQAA